MVYEERSPVAGNLLFPAGRDWGEEEEKNDKNREKGEKNKTKRPREKTTPRVEQVRIKAHGAEKTNDNHILNSE